MLLRWMLIHCSSAAAAALCVCERMREENRRGVEREREGEREGTSAWGMLLLLI